MCFFGGAGDDAVGYFCGLVLLVRVGWGGVCKDILYIGSLALTIGLLQTVGVHSIAIADNDKVVVQPTAPTAIYKEQGGCRGFVKL